MKTSESCRGVLDEIAAERERQDRKWGVQMHPSVDGSTGPGQADYDLFYEIPTALRAKQLCDGAARHGECTWAHIAVEELCESVEAAAVHGQYSAQLREELIQTAAVLVSWAQRVDRHNRGDG